MKYRVKDGHTVNWPDGTLRARAGEIFEGYDTEPDSKRNIAARGFMRGQWTACVPVTETDIACDAVGNALPPAFLDRLREVGPEVVTRGSVPGAGVEHTGLDILEMGEDFGGEED